jgi:hypothetical protein
MKQTGSRRDYLNWAGWFSDPVEEHDAFITLPAYRQNEILEFKKHSATGLPFTPEVLANIYRFAPDPDFVLKEPIADWFKYSFEDATLTLLRRNTVELSMTPQDLIVVKEALSKHVTGEAVIQACTVRGKGQQIKTNKPSDGVMAYVWRMARFNNGADVTIPVTCYWDLSDGVKALTGVKDSFSIMTPESREVVDMLNRTADELVVATGGDKNAAAKRWGRAMGYTI